MTRATKYHSGEELLAYEYDVSEFLDGDKTLNENIENFQSRIILNCVKSLELHLWADDGLITISCGETHGFLAHFDTNEMVKDCISGEDEIEELEKLKKSISSWLHQVEAAIEAAAT